MIRDAFIPSAPSPEKVEREDARLRDEHRRARRFALGVFAGCMLLVLLAWSAFRQGEMHEMQEGLRQSADRYVHVLRLEISAKERLLRGAAGLIASSDHVTGREWTDYVEAVDGGTVSSGLLAVGYSQNLSGGAGASFDASMNEAEYPDFVRPAGVTSFHTSAVTRIAPFTDATRAMLGRDLGDDPTLSKVIERVRSSGEVALAWRKQGLSMPEQANVLVMVHPLYRAGATASTAQEREANFAGFVFVEFGLAALAQSARLGLDAEHHVEIVDRRQQPQRTLFDTAADSAAEADIATVKREFANFGLDWTLEFSRHASSVPLVRASSIALTAGTLASVLFALLMLHQATARMRAEISARRMTSDLLRSELGLKQSQALLSSVLDGLPSGVALKDANLRITFANRSFCELMGRQPGELIGMSSTDLLSAEDAAVIEGYDRLAQQSGEQQEFELNLIGQNGEARCFQVRKLCLPGGEGKVLAVFTDVSAMHEQTQAVEAYKVFLERLFQVIPHALYVKDADLRYVQVNQAFADQVKMNPADMIGRRGSEFLIGDIGPQSEQRDRELLANGGGGSWEWVLIDTAGAKHDILTTKMRLTGPNGELLIVGVNTDLTEVKSQTRMMRALIDHLPQRIFIKDRESHYLIANRTIANDAGVTPDEMRGKSDYDYYPAELADRYRADDQRIMASGLIDTFEEPYVNGWLRTTKVPMRDEAGNVVGVVGIFDDITSRRSYEEQLREALARFESVVENTPLVAIKGVDRHGVIRHWNRACCGLYGIEREEAIGKRLAELLYEPEMHAYLEHSLNKMFEEGGVGGKLADWSYKMPNGRQVDVYSTMFPVSVGDSVREVFFMDVDISALKRAEARLRESEARWQFALEGSGDGVWDWMIPEGIMNLSPRLHAILGFDDGELNGPTDALKSLMHPDDHKRVAANMGQHLRGETQTFVSEHRLRCKGGDYKWILVRGRVMSRDESGAPLRMIGTHSDISERKRAEQILFESEARFRLLADSTPNMIWLSDGGEGRSYFNKTWLDFAGATTETERGKGWLQRVHPEDIDRCKAVYASAAEDRVSYEVEYRVRRHDGACRWILETGVPRFSGELEFTGYIGSCLDITERREMEIEMQRNRELIAAINRLQEDFIRLPDSNEMFDHLLGWLLHTYSCELGVVAEAAASADGSRHLLPLAVGRIVWDSDSGLYQKASAWEAVELQNPDSMFARIAVSKDPVICNDAPADPRTHPLPSDHPSIANFLGIPVHKDDEVLGMVVLANRERGFDDAVVAELEPLLNTFGKLLLARHSDQARKAAEAELARHRDNLREMVEEQTREANEARDEAQRANRVKSEFLSNMSHELRTPMHAILSFARLGEARAKKENHDKLFDYFDRIHVSGDRLLTLLDDLLDLSKLEAGKMMLDLRVQSVVSLVEDAMVEFEAMYQSKGVSLRLVRGESIPDASVDGTRFGQVIRNLLSNAVKFTPLGRSVEVRIDAKRVPYGRRAEDAGRTIDGIELMVSDEGVGIPEAELEHVFDKFVQSSKTRTGAGGTGLGLAISREIIEAHGGSIFARHNAKGGAEFVIRIPLRLIKKVH